MALCYNCFREMNTEGPCPYCGYDGTDDRKRYPVALKRGAILNGRYIVGRVLGQGGFGITYIAQDYRTKGRVAIKEYYPVEFAARSANGSSVQAFSDSRAENFTYGKAKFLEEAETLAAVTGNDSIVSVYSYFEENDTAYFVMEYAEGEPLDKLLTAQGPMEPETARAMFLPLMEALDWVHGKGIVHRDISPDNIIVMPTGKAKLIDFGAARYSTGEKSRSIDVILKHGFAPREQYARHGRQGPWTDVYALAATYYYAVTGTIPPDAIDRVGNDELRTPGALGVRMEPETEAALLKGMAVAPQDRWQTMADFAAAIRSSGGKAPKASGTALAGSGDTRKKRLPVLLGAALLVALAIFGGVKLTGRTRPGNTPAEMAAGPAAASQPTAAPTAVPETWETQTEAVSAAEENYETPVKIKQITTGDYFTAALLTNGKVVAVGYNEYWCGDIVKEAAEWTDVTAISADITQLVGLRADGTVVAAGESKSGECNVSDWRDIVAVSAGHTLTLGLRSDGTVLAAGSNSNGECEVSDWTDIVDVEAGSGVSFGLRSDGTVLGIGDDKYNKNKTYTWAHISAVSAGDWHTLGLRSDGTVRAIGQNSGKQCEVGSWTEIVQIAAGGYHSVGLRSDGTVVAVGWNDYGQCDVSDWSDIVQISACNFHTVALRGDGILLAAGENSAGQCDMDALLKKAYEAGLSPLVESGSVRQIAAGGDTAAVRLRNGRTAAVGSNSSGQCDVSSWGDISDLAVGLGHTVGLRADGSVPAVGDNRYGQCDTDGWTDVVAVAAGDWHTVGLLYDGTVRTAGLNDSGQCDVPGWSEIEAAAAGSSHTVALRADGTVLAAGDNSYGQCGVSAWTEIQAVAAGGNHTVGLRADGTVLAAGDNSYGQCEVSNWKNVTAVAAGRRHTVALCSDGTVLTAGDNGSGQCEASDWRRIVAVAAGDDFTIGLRTDGSVTAVGGCDAELLMAKIRKCL